MGELIVIPPGRGEIIGDSPDRRVEILADHRALTATWSRFGPRRDGADLHVHRFHTDLFYVLEGELTVMLGTGGDELAVRAGTLARVPPLVVHGFRNGTDAELRYLNLHAPGRGFAEYLRALRDGRTLTYDQEAPPADGGRPAAEAVIGGAADIDAIRIAEVRTDRGEPSPLRQGSTVESLYVLEGTLALTVGDRDREFEAEAGAWVQLPPGAEHTISARGPAPARYLHLRTPKTG